MQCLRNIQRCNFISFTRGLPFCQFSSKSIDVNQLRVELTKEFQSVGIERRESLLSAEYIIAHVLGKKMFHEVSRKTMIPKAQWLQIKELAKKRSERMPLQYVLGEWDFHDFTVKLSPPVLIPRPETEELVEYVLQDVGPDRSCQKFLEVGCGSGAVTLCLLSKLPWITAVACDISREACDLTTENLTKYQVDGRAVVLNMDFKDSETIQRICELGPFDFILSNPPYIPSADIDHLDPEVKTYEDRRALDGGQDGLDFVRHLLAVSPPLLKTNGKLWLETGLEQHGLIKKMIDSKPEQNMTFLQSLEDITNRERFCLIQKRSR
ncbi:MTRF1L release factor glutamine methyltransferase-like [Crassostrea virginica]